MATESEVMSYTISGHGLEQLERMGRDVKAQYKASLGNNAVDEEGKPYAAALHFDPRLAGRFLVLDREHLVRGLLESFKEHLETHLVSNNLVINALKAACVREVAFYQTFTGEMRPPVTAGGDERPAHPGHFADITRTLAGSYHLVVEEEDVELPAYGTA